MNTYRHGALVVVEQARSSDSILRDLKSIDPRLFLERQMTLDNQLVWCVVVAVGGDEPPITILEWRDNEGRPLPELGSRLVDQVARMERDGKKLAASVIRKNRDLIERRRHESQQIYNEIAEDMTPRMSGLRSAVLHRGVHLRRSRDRIRRQGGNV